MRKLDWRERDVVDAAAALTYRLKNQVLDAIRFEDGTIRWSLPCPVESPSDGALIQSDPDVLAILFRGVLACRATIRPGSPGGSTPTASKADSSISPMRKPTW